MDLETLSKKQLVEYIEELLEPRIERLREIAQAARTHTHNNRRLERAYADLQDGDVEFKPRT